MPAAIENQGVGELPVVQPIVARQTEVACHFRHHPSNRQVPERIAGDPGERRRNVDRADVVGERDRSVEPKAQHDSRRSTKMCADVRRSGTYCACAPAMIEIGGLSGGMRSTSPAVIGVTHEHVVARRKPMVDASLKEMLVGGLRVREQILGRAASERCAVRAREQQVEIRRDRRM